MKHSCASAVQHSKAQHSTAMLHNNNNKLKTMPAQIRFAMSCGVHLNSESGVFADLGRPLAVYGSRRYHQGTTPPPAQTVRRGDRTHSSFGLGGPRNPLYTRSVIVICDQPALHMIAPRGMWYLPQIVVMHAEPSSRARGPSPITYAFKEVFLHLVRKPSGGFLAA